MASGLPGPATANVLPLEQVIWEDLKDGKNFIFNQMILGRESYKVFQILWNKLVVVKMGIVILFRVNKCFLRVAKVY